MSFSDVLSSRLSPKEQAIEGVESETKKAERKLMKEVYNKFSDFLESEFISQGADQRMIAKLGISGDLIEECLNKKENLRTAIENNINQKYKNKKRYKNLRRHKELIDTIGFCENSMKKQIQQLESNTKEKTITNLNNVKDLYEKLTNKKHIANVITFKKQEQLEEESEKIKTESEKDNNHQSNNKQEEKGEGPSNEQPQSGVHQQKQETNQTTISNKEITSNDKSMIATGNRLKGKQYMSRIQGNGKDIYGLDCSGLVSQGLRELKVLRDDQYLRVPSLIGANTTLDPDTFKKEHTEFIAKSFDTRGAAYGKTPPNNQFEVRSKRLEKAKAGDILFRYSEQPQYKNCGGLNHVAIIKDVKEENGKVFYKLVESVGCAGVTDWNDVRIDPTVHCGYAPHYSKPVVQSLNYDAIKKQMNP